MEDLRAVGEHGGRGRAGVETALVDLADVGDDVGLDAAGLPENLDETAQQLVVRNGLQLVSCLAYDQYRQAFLEGVAACLPSGERASWPSKTSRRIAWLVGLSLDGTPAL